MYDLKNLAGVGTGTTSNIFFSNISLQGDPNL